MALQIAASETATITATLNWKSVNTTLNLVAASQTISSLTCDSPVVVAGGETQCTVELEGAAENGGVVRLAAEDPRIGIPETVQIPRGGSSARFALRSRPADRDAESRIVAAVGESAKTATLGVRGLRPAALACLPKALKAGERAVCELRLNTSELEQAVSLEVWANGGGLRLPASVTTRPRQATLTFVVKADRACGDEVVTIGARFGSNTAQDTVTTVADRAPVLTVPGDQLVRFGSRLGFTVSAVDPPGLPVEIAASGIPDGATFDARTGRFEWIPDESQQGRHEIAFTARNSANASSTARVLVDVDAGRPSIDRVLNGGSQREQAACSPGARGTIVGRWLFHGEEPLGDPSGGAVELGRTRVKINGRYAPVLYASPLRVDFQCPSLEVGAALQVTVENLAGVAEPVSVVMEDAGPGLLTLDGSGQGQGLVFLSGTSSLAMSRDYRSAGLPVQPGDRISLRVTGLGSWADAASVVVAVGGMPAPADSVSAVPGEAGVYEVATRVPAGVEGEAVPVNLRVAAPGGRPMGSNAVTITIEGGRP